MSKIGYVYKLCCNDVNISEIYVGSTANMKERRRTHKCVCDNPDSNHVAAKLKVYECIRANGGFNNWSMVMVETVNYDDKKQLHTRERFHLEELKATLNAKIPTRTDKEYYEANKEHISQYYREWYVENKDYVKQYDKEKYIANKDIIKQRSNERYNAHKADIRQYKNVKHNCECGGKYTTGGKLKHMKTKKHINFIATIASK